MVVREVDEEILSGHQLHDGVAQKLHPLVVAPGRRKEQEGREEWRRGEVERGGSDVSGWFTTPSNTITPRKQQETQLMPQCPDAKS